jgi:hypothetical protein
MDPHPSSRRLLEPPLGAARVTDGRGTLTFWQLSPHIYATEMRGFMTPEMSALIIERAEPLYTATGKLHGFHNWLEMSNYESSCRVDLTAWVMRHRSQSVLHIGVRSRMVAMGVSVANLALGSLIEVYSTADALEAAMQAALRQTS